MQTTAIITVISILLSLALVIHRIYISGKKNAKRNNLDYSTLQEGDLIKVSCPGYHHVAIFNSKSDNGHIFTATVFDFNQEIKERNKVLTRLQFLGKV